jgi:RNA polymerase sigma-70 factor (ECF subfamily)
LIARVLGTRDTEAFATLVAENQSQVRTFLLRLCRNHDQADDLAQETFITAYQKLATFQGSGSFRSWLFGIAYRRFLMVRRAQNRDQEMMSAYGERLALETDRYQSITEIQLELEKALAQLNRAEAAAITLCHSFGLSHQQAADILHTPLGTVKSQIRRGMEKLREVLSVPPPDSAAGDERLANESSKSRRSEKADSPGPVSNRPAGSQLANRRNPVDRFHLTGS